MKNRKSYITILDNLDVLLEAVKEIDQTGLPEVEFNTKLKWLQDYKVYINKLLKEEYQHFIDNNDLRIVQMFTASKVANKEPAVLTREQ